MSTLWLNPLPKQPIGSFLCFDFPADKAPLLFGSHPYCSTNGAPNVDFATEEIESLYGNLGVPERPQAQPRIYELPQGTGDPGLKKHDQMIDVDHQIIINHTARISGDFIPWLINPKFQMLITVDALPETTAATPINLSTITIPLEPQAENVNVCFWRNPAAGNPARPDPRFPPELLMNIKLEGKTCKEYGLKPEELYKLMIRWSLWYTYDKKTKERVPVGGFTETEAFQVITKHTIMPD